MVLKLNDTCESWGLSKIDMETNILNSQIKILDTSIKGKQV